MRGPASRVLTADYPPCIVHSVDGKVLRRLRRGCGLTQTDLARRLGVHWNTLARWERDEVPIRPAMAQLITLQIKLLAKVRRG